MSKLYEAVGRLVMYFVWMRYGRQIKIGLGVGLLALVAGAFLAASRAEVEEG